MEWKTRLLLYRLPPPPSLALLPISSPIFSSSASSLQIACVSSSYRSAGGAVRRSVPQQIRELVGMSIQGTNDLREWNARVVERRTAMDFDLNCPPPDECIDPTGPREEAAQFYNRHQQQATDSSDVVDEDIAIISPRKFAEARKNFRRNHFDSSCGVAVRLNGNTEVYGALSGETSWPPFTIWPPLTINNNASVREQTIHDLDLCLSSESSSRARTKATDSDIPSALAQSSSITPPAAPSLRCAICIEPLVEETTTKCGHVFCRNCIETAIATQHRCPICRRKLRKRDIIRIYLPFST